MKKGYLVNRKVLVADSQHVERMRLAGYLRKKGGIPLCAATMREAEELTRLHCPAVAVVSFFLGGHAALSLVELLLGSTERGRVIVTTEFASAHAAVASFRAGAFDFYEKPVSPENLYRSILGDRQRVDANTKHCSLKRLEREHIARVLFSTDGNVTAAAKILHVHRQSLQRKLRSEGFRAPSSPRLSES